MIFIEKMKNMKIYKQPCFLPTVEGNKKKDSAIILLSPSYESSKKLMNNPLFVNKKRFESYFLDRDVSYYIGNKQLKEVDEAFLYLEETRRSDLKDSDFGIPEDRKYPLDTEQHVRSAIKLFGHAEESKKKSLAKRISRKASKYGIKIPETTQCYKYLHETVLTDNPQIKNIVFDLGSVLVQETTREDLYIQFPDIPVDNIDIILRMVHDMWAMGDYENASFDEQVQFLISESDPQFRNVIPEVYRQIILSTTPYEYTTELLKLLKSRGYKLYFLSNWCQASFEMLVKESNVFDFFQLLDGGMVSYQTGTGKPDPRFYEMFIEKYGLQYDECLFFDDRKENIQAAEQLGMKAYVFDYTSTYKEIMEDIPVTEAFEAPKEDDNLDFIFSTPLTDIMDIKYEMDEKEKRWNSIVIVKGVAPKTLRGRSECIVIRDDLVYLDETENGICSKGGIAKIKYDVPGGGWDPNEPHDICAIRETNEEAMIDVKDVEYVDNYLVIDKVRPDDCYCDGLYSKVYVGKYNGRYTGPIADVDRADIAVSGNWYKIDQVYDLLNPIHKKAIDQYLGREPELVEFEHPVDESLKEDTQVNTNILYHVSPYNLDGRTISPTVPKNYLTKNGYEDTDVKRVCFSTSIDGCLMGLSQNLTGKEYYVYTPDDISKYDVMRPDVEEVPDSKVTNEHWICSPVTMKMIGKIRVIDSTRDPIPYTYGEYTAELYPWNWEWIEKKHESVFITEDSLQKSELDSNFKKKSISDINYEVIDFHSSKAKKYIETDSYLSNLYHKNQLKDFNGEIIGDKDNGTVIGRVFIGTGKDKGYIGALRVYDKYKGYGFGDILIKDAINKYGGYDLNVFKDNEVALKMYKKYGFEVSDEDSSDSSYYMKLKSKMNEAYIEENYLKNDKDILYNKEAFDRGDINLCFITGHSGSGKSTMGRNLQNKDNIEHYELDDLQCIKDHFTMNNLKEYGDLIYSYFKGPGKKFYMTFEELKQANLPGSEYEDKLFPDFVHYAMKYAKTHKDKKFIIEGVWLFGDDDNNKPWFTPEEFKDYAFYIKGTSMIISKYRGAKRDSQWDNGSNKELKGLDRFKSFNKRFFLQNWKYYILDEKSISRFRKYFEKQEKTIKENYIKSIKKGTEFILET